MNISDTLRAMHGVPPISADDGADSCSEPQPEAVSAIRQKSPVQSQVSGSMMLDQLPLAMAYVPMQMWGETYEGLKALDVGTIFPDLNLPFRGRRLSE